MQDTGTRNVCRIQVGGIWQDTGTRNVCRIQVGGMCVGYR